LTLSILVVAEIALFALFISNLAPANQVQIGIKAIIKSGIKSPQKSAKLSLGLHHSTHTILPYI
jgi:hypothetical protein